MSSVKYTSFTIETKVIVVIPDKDDSYHGRYEIYLHDMAGEILAAIKIREGNNKLEVLKDKITEDIAERLFSEFRRELKIDELMDEEI